VLASLTLHLLALPVLGHDRESLVVSAQPVEPTASASWSGTTFDVDAVLATPNRGAASVDERSGMARTESERAAAEVVARAAPSASLLDSAPTASLRTTPRRPRAPRPEPAQKRAASVGKHSGTEEAASAVTSSGGAGSAPASASFGAEGAVQRQDIGRAFTRALPRAASSQAQWRTVAGDFDETSLVFLSVDDGGHLLEVRALAQLEPERPSGAEVRELVRRTVALLGSGTFALRAGGAAGEQRLKLRVRVVDGSPSGELEGEVTIELGYQPPEGSHPGHGTVRLANGRRLELTLWVLSP